MKQRINVTEADIQGAVQGAPMACMVWRAVTRNLQLESGTGSEPVSVHVRYDGITFSGEGGQISVKHAYGVQSKIRRWDTSRDSVAPFAFDLNLPDDWRQQVTKAGQYSITRLKADGTEI